MNNLFRSLPSVDACLSGLENAAPMLYATTPRPLLRSLTNAFLDGCRRDIKEGRLTDSGQLGLDALLPRLAAFAEKGAAPRFRRVLNATGVVIHTNMGRSVLADEAVDAILKACRGYSNLELNLATGERGSRYSHVEELLCTLTGAEAALVVNNNAAAVLITMDALCSGGEVVVARGQLVEIGGSFRIPDVMERSGATLREVGCTNRVHPQDYENAINERTVALMRVHTSNYRIVGFHADVPVEELADMAHRHGLPLIEDLGSGSFLNFTAAGLPGEPTVPNNLPLVAVGAGLLWFGWFGFNAGGAYAADGLAAYAFTNTTIAGSIAMIVWMLYDWHYDRKPSFSGVLVGAVAGLATITPCAGYVEPWAAIVIGAVGSTVCYYAKHVQERLGFDDALEVWRAHGMGGVTGALLLGILASSRIDKVSASIHQFLMQLLGVIIVAVYSFVVTIIIFKVISAWGPIRVTKEEEEAGLDESLHGEDAYKM